jgi:CheY-like chemotaxis protein
MTVILVVEDELDTAELIRFALEREGYGVVLAGDGREALGRLEEAIPAAVLTDLMMPYLDGRELAEIMKAHARYRDVPIIAMTAAPDSIRHAEAFVAVIRKPFDLDRIVELVRRVAPPSPESGRG